MINSMAPEICECFLFGQSANTLTTKADVYSFGCIILEVLTGNISLPFNTSKISVTEVYFSFGNSS